ncbi:hypothetical protein AB0E25_36060 [Streptomyces bobili]
MPLSHAHIRTAVETYLARQPLRGGGDVPAVRSAAWRRTRSLVVGTMRSR